MSNVHDNDDNEYDDDEKNQKSSLEPSAQVS